ncbi:helix-turn-helix domain-containing protein [Brassicibacter mesophilus]|uniref:helix-turn-helix domain-containing protein n=1 Tax=Brassicibacter mesophilus TaxID=745119 RepID=UPI003D227101
MKNIRIKKMSQRELARRIGVNHSYISKIENNVEPPPSEETLINIARELDIDAEKLILEAKKVPSTFESLITQTPEVSNFLSIIKDKDISRHVIDRINKLILNEIQDTEIIRKTLMENEKKYELLFNNVNDAIFLNEVDNNGIISNIIDANKTACKKLGYTKEELINIDLKNLFDKDFLINNPEIIRKISNCQEFAFEIICISKAGSAIIFDINSQRFDLFDKEVVITIARDITDKKVR